MGKSPVSSKTITLGKRSRSPTQAGQGIDRFPTQKRGYVPAFSAVAILASSCLGALCRTDSRGDWQRQLSEEASKVTKPMKCRKGWLGQALFGDIFLARLGVLRQPDDTKTCMQVHTPARSGKAPSSETAVWKAT